jgi:hypothetical protein
MAKKRREQKAQPKQEFPPALPRGRPMPSEANPGGVEGAEPDWRGGSSNLGEVMNPPFEQPSTYSSKDSDGAPRVDVVARYLCDHCGQAFHTNELLAVHMRTSHHPPHRRHASS